MHFFRIVWEFLKDEEYRELIYIVVITLILGTLVFHHLEGWSYVDALYFSVVTLTTVGFGDFSPATTYGKLFAIVYIFIGIGIILNFVNVAFDHYSKVAKERSKEKKERKGSK